MADQRFDALLRRAASVASRRASLAMLGVAVVATTAPWTIPVQAGKKAKKRASRKKCKKQVAACRDVFRDVCESELDCEEGQLEEIFPCCELLSNCNAGESVACFFEVVF